MLLAALNGCPSHGFPSGRILLRHHAPTVKQHDRHVHPAITGGNDARAHAVEVGLVKLRQVKLGLAVQCRPRSWTRIRHRVEPGAVGSPYGSYRLLPAPQPKEVVMVSLQKVQVRGVVENGRGRRRACILQVCPGVRTGQVQRPAAIREVARILRVDTQRAGSRCWLRCRARLGHADAPDGWAVAACAQQGRCSEQCCREINGAIQQQMRAVTRFHRSPR